VLRSGSRVRITAQLIQASSDKHLWAESYEGELQDTLALQNKVARAIAQQICIKLSPKEDELKTVPILNHEAYEDYLKGRYCWNKRTGDGLKKAVEYFDQAIDKDAGYAQAYSGLADSYALMGDWEYGIMAPKEAFPKAKAAATKALELDNTLGEAHTSLAFCQDVFEWDWPAAEKEYQRASSRSRERPRANQQRFDPGSTQAIISVWHFGAETVRRANAQRGQKIAGCRAGRRRCRSLTRGRVNGRADADAGCVGFHMFSGGTRAACTSPAFLAPCCATRHRAFGDKKISRQTRCFLGPTDCRTCDGQGALSLGRCRR
jgi:tetratricopeptide (TPR) repeat protein